MEVGVSNEIGVPSRVALLYYSRDGSSPSVVAPRVEEALIDCSSHEAVLEVLLFLFGTFVHIEHLRKRVTMILQPKFILPLYIFVRSVKVWVRF